MMPLGLNSRMNASLTSFGWISQYTCASRTRRAISWVTWEPKSRMRILSCCSLDVVIRRLLRDLDIVHVRLAHSRGSDLDEFRARAQVVDRAATRIAHARAQSA